MKLKAKVKAQRAGIDVAKTHKLASNLQQLSFEQRARELGQSTKVKVNIRGNRRGMHMAGQSEEMSKLRALRRLWNAKMPVMHCGNCAFSQQCPSYKAGYECAFNRFFDAHTIQNETDLIYYAKELCGQGMKRAQQMLLTERLSGGAPSLETTEALSITFAQLMQLYDRVSEQTDVEIESSDATIIGKLFGGLDGLVNETDHMLANPIDVPSTIGEASLDQDVGALTPPTDSTMPPLKTADAELVREYSAVTNSKTKEKVL